MIDAAAESNALARLVNAGIPVLEQAVLLTRVNDSTAALLAAMRAALPRYAIPCYVQEITGEPGKRVLARL